MTGDDARECGCSSSRGRGISPSLGGGLRLGVLVVCAALVTGCGLVRLHEDLGRLESGYLLTGAIANAIDYDSDVWVVVVERDLDGRVVSADVGRTGRHGRFAFMLDSSERHYVVAFADIDGDAEYESGEPAWMLSSRSGELYPVRFLEEQRRAMVVGRLSDRVVVPEDLLRAGKAYRADRPIEEVARGWNIPVGVGEVANLDEDRFSAERGAAGLWEPVSFPMKSGVGIFFLEPYDPTRIPILFVHGAGGSPQHWKKIFAELDRSRFQAWFFLYPTGRRLGEMADWLNRGVTYLHEFYEFDRMGLIAHSMGGLVSRAFLNENVVRDGSAYVELFVTISTPWSGHEQARSGVERSPVVVPAWHDLATGSEFLEELLAPASPSLPPYHLFFSFHGKRSMILPSSNDGTISVASQLRREAQRQAVRVYGFDVDHVEILRDDSVIETLNRILDEGL